MTIILVSTLTTPTASSVSLANPPPIKEQKIEKTYLKSNIPLPENLQDYLYYQCQEYKVDYTEALAVLLTENPKCDILAVHINNDGSRDSGLFQTNSCHKKRLKDQLGVTNFLDPYASIVSGCFMLSELSKYQGESKFIAYNYGERGAQKAISRGITSTRYSRSVVDKITELKEVK